MKRTVAGAVSLISLAICLLSPFAYLWGYVSENGFRQVLVSASLGWFVAATIWSAKRPK